MAVRPAAAIHCQTQSSLFKPTCFESKDSKAAFRAGKPFFACVLNLCDGQIDLHG